MSTIGKHGVASTTALALAFLFAGCHHQGNAQNQDPTNVQAQATDPANGNLAPANGEIGSSPQAVPAAPAANNSPAANQYAQNAPPYAAQSTPYADQSAPYADPNFQDQNDQGYDNEGYDDSQYQEEAPIEAAEPPPLLPEYVQPECPGENYMWTPGYWYWASPGYYWVPGAWVLAPYIGALWTPGYWGWGGRYYRFHRGYWGRYIGFYGGVPYGYGYTGRGYYGGYWQNGAFRYNRSVTRVNVNIVRNVYSRTVIINRTNSSRVSYNGGRGGINIRPTRAENIALRDRRMSALPAQVQHVRQAAANRKQFASVNRGRPATLAAARPLPTRYKAPAVRPPAPIARPGR
ncbi:MAG: YXWGXW repeat-containing protein, partial [Acidobacteriaceae bacterium]